VLKDEVKDVDGVARALTLRYGGHLRYVYTAALRGFAVKMPDALANALRNELTVAYVEQDQEVHVTTEQTNTTWGLQRVSQPVPLQAPLNNPWDYPRNPFTYTYTYTYFADGTGVTVYVIDTGIETSHPDFGGRASVGFDAFGGNGIDCNGHGTHVGGTAGGSNWGVAKNVHLVAVRVLDCQGSGTESGVIAGVNWVTANRVLPAVANMSLGGPLSTLLNQAVENSISGGVTYTISAGNDHVDACNVSPASAPNAITVGATNIAYTSYSPYRSDGFASFSNYGSCVRINAPGVAITSDWLNGATRVDTGTSMASPHVAGTAALYLSVNTTATPAQVRTALTTNADSGFIAGLPANTPNLLVYSGFIGTTVTASGGFSAQYAPITSPWYCDGSFNPCPAPDFVAVTASGSGAINVSDNYHNTGTITLTGLTGSGGLTARYAPITSPWYCDGSFNPCPAPDIVAVTASGGGAINISDNYHNMGTITLMGATAWGGFTARADPTICDASLGQNCPPVGSVAVTGRSNTIILRDNYAGSGYVMLR